MRYHFTPVRKSIMKKTKDNICCQGCGEREYLYTIGGVQIGTAIMENNEVK